MRPAASGEMARVMWHCSAIAIALASCAAWVGLLVGRGGFWRERPDTHAQRPPYDVSKVRVEAVVPARDEVAVIASALPSLTSQAFAGTLNITLVDDDSQDATVAAARSAIDGQAGSERCTIVSAGPLPAGWTGKLNALQSGVRAALSRRAAPDYWLFTDADICHDPNNVTDLVTKARRDGLDLVSLMVRLRCASRWERILIPAFIFFFQKLYPFAWSNDRRRTTAAAAGGCILVSHAALERIGGLQAIHDRLIDDCALAERVKQNGGRIWIGLSDRTRSIRAYDTLADLWTMIRRTAYTQLRHSPAALGLTVFGMTFLYAVPVAAVLAGALGRDPPLLLAGGAGWMLMAAAYFPTVRAYELSPVLALTLPFSAALYTAMTVDSALAHARKHGSSWKGRRYAIPYSQ